MPSFFQLFVGFFLSIFIIFDFICQVKENNKETKCNNNCGKKSGGISESYLKSLAGPWRQVEYVTNLN